jgi:hypothetical protein
MPQEVSISYQAVKSKVYKLVDAMVEGDKNTLEVQESIRRWWKLLMVLEKSNSTLGAIVLGLPDAKEAKAVHDLDMEQIPTRSDRTAVSSPV